MRDLRDQDLKIIKQFEGLRLKAYKDSVGIWTIGYGTIKYPNGTRVKEGDVINIDQAEEYLLNHVQSFQKELEAIVKVELNDNQYAALLSFIYNLGGSNLRSSTLLRKINKNPNDTSIAAEFAKWNKAGGKVIQGLTNRRLMESQLYFKIK